MNDDSAATIYFMSTMGIGSLIHLLRNATGAFLPNPKPRYLKSLAILNGSGLEAMIQEYCLDYDANKIRQTFYWCVRHS